MSAKASNKCVVCGKTAYETERSTVDGTVFHKWCLRCETCNKTISPLNCTALKGRFFCKPCYIKAFKQKGNYDEGFGNEQHKKKWAPAVFGVRSQSFCAPSSSSDASQSVAADPAKPAEHASEHPVAEEVQPEKAAEAPVAEEKKTEEAPLKAETHSPRPRPVSMQVPQRSRSAVLARAPPLQDSAVAAVRPLPSTAEKSPRSSAAPLASPAAPPALPDKPGEVKPTTTTAIDHPASPPPKVVSPQPKAVPAAQHKVEHPAPAQSPVVATSPAPSSPAPVVKATPPAEAGAKTSSRAAALAKFNAMINAAQPQRPQARASRQTVMLDHTTAKAAASGEPTHAPTEHSAEATKTLVPAVSDQARDHAAQMAVKKQPLRAQSMRIPKGSSLLERLKKFDPSYNLDAEDLNTPALIEVQNS